MTEAAFFYLFTTVMLAAALCVVLSRQPIYSVLSLLVVMFCLASLFVMLGAYFLAALQVLLYAGAVLVLFLFIIMLLNLEPEALARMRLFTLRSLGIATATALLYQLLRSFESPVGEPPLAQVASPSGTVEAIGRLLFVKYLLPFELASFLILAAIIGAVTLAKQKSNR
ncbi:MAG: NADH-quinone oxidoreductase subunit J [Candidatus Omnitrophica bacterium]|nr:NADH-quinone oxidoreductase subunit J [Candidatus Omnitrophota bacterium]